MLNTREYPYTGQVRLLSGSIVLFLTALGCGEAQLSSTPELAQEKAEGSFSLPPGFEQVIPRGAISSIDEPVFVSARDAEIRDEAWILGVVVNSQAKAYSLNLLNRHEIVNDREGDQTFSAVW